MYAKQEEGVIGVLPKEENIIDALRSVGDASILEELEIEEFASGFAKAFEAALSELIDQEVEMDVISNVVVEAHWQDVFSNPDCDSFAFLIDPSTPGIGFKARRTDVQKLVQSILSKDGVREAASPRSGSSAAERAIFSRLLFSCFDACNRKVGFHYGAGAQLQCLQELGNPAKKAIGSGVSETAVQTIFKLQLLSLQIELYLFVPIIALQEKRRGERSDAHLAETLRWNGALEAIARDLPIALSACLDEREYPIINLLEAKEGTLLRTFSPTDLLAIDFEDGSQRCRGKIMVQGKQLAFRIFNK